jgi:hypothetical protein
MYVVVLYSKRCCRCLPRGCPVSSPLLFPLLSSLFVIICSLRTGGETWRRFEKQKQGIYWKLSHTALQCKRRCRQRCPRHPISLQQGQLLRCLYQRPRRKQCRERLHQEVNVLNQTGTGSRGLLEEGQKKVFSEGNCCGQCSNLAITL